MQFEAHNAYHIYNQGNNQEPIFYEQVNYLFFLSKMRKLPRNDFKIIAYCLMPNHFHMMIYADFPTECELDKSKKYSRQIGIMLSSYTKAINNRYDHTGSLFRKRTKAKCLTADRYSDDRYVETCFHYIHQNPMKAGLVVVPGAWPYSSYPDYVGSRNGSLPDIEMGYNMLGFKSGEDFKKKSRKVLKPDMIEEVY